VALEAPAKDVEETPAAAPAAPAPDSETPVPVGEPEARRVFDSIAANFEAPPSAQEFAWELVSEVCARTSCLDGQIAARARNWRISRMAAVDRNILRLGTYELAHTSTPAPVVMDEAVELARRYGSDASPSFVNGILDALATILRRDAS
jgi:transcription antitermination factor NusB